MKPTESSIQLGCTEIFTLSTCCSSEGWSRNIPRRLFRKTSYPRPISTTIQANHGRSLRQKFLDSPNVSEPNYPTHVDTLQKQPNSNLNLDTSKARNYSRARRSSSQTHPQKSLLRLPSRNANSPSTRTHGPKKIISIIASNKPVKLALQKNST